MQTRNLILAGLILSVCTACLGALTTSERPVYYELSSAPELLPCAVTWPESLQIWPFSAAAPYDREEMIIVEPSRKVRFSPHFRWVSIPGVLIADKLTEDLARSNIFTQVVTPASPLTPTMQLSGHVQQFAGEDQGKAGEHALLDVQISVWRKEDLQHDVLLQKHYRLTSDRFSEGSPEKFAEAMSRLVARLSTQLQQDLCSIAPNSSSRSSD